MMITENSKKTVEHNGREYIMPNHIQIETVGGKGMCNARCDMCTINDWQKPPRIMKNPEFEKFVDDLIPFKEHFDYITLHCNGEPLMDKHLHEKVRYLKDNGFRGTGFATNGSMLTEKRSIELIEAGLDTIIVSLDGITKETHEKIRKGLNYEKIVKNVLSFIDFRNKYALNNEKVTRIIIRFIMQPLNKHEWDDYQVFWKKNINKNLNDEILYFPIHNWGGQLDAKERMRQTYGDGRKIFYCEDMHERMIIFSDGNVSHCDADYNGFYPHGNVFKNHFLDIYNNSIFNKYRKYMSEGKILELTHCTTCTIPLGREDKGSVELVTESS